MSQIKSRLTCNKKFPSKFNIVDPFKSIEVLHSVHTSESYSYRIRLGVNDFRQGAIFTKTIVSGMLYK